MFALKINTDVEWKAQRDDKKRKKSPVHQFYKAGVIPMTLR